MTKLNDIPTLPESFLTSCSNEVKKLVDNNIPLFVNPMMSVLNNGVADIASQAGAIPGIQTLLSSVSGAASLISSIGNIGTTLTNLTSSFGNMLNHTGQMIFGGGSGILSGGLIKNLQNMMQGLGIKKTLYGFDQIPFPSGCPMLNDFFGSIMGAGAGLIGNAMGIVSSIGNMFSLIQSLVGQGLSAITNALSSLTSMASNLISGITGAISNITNMISNELAAFGDIMNLAKNFISMFNLVNNLLNNCALPLMSNVGSPELQDTIKDSFKKFNPTPTNSLPMYDSNGRIIVYNGIKPISTNPTYPLENATDLIITNNNKLLPVGDILGNIGFDQPNISVLPNNNLPYIDKETIVDGIIPGSQIIVTPEQSGNIITEPVIPDGLNITLNPRC